MRRLASFLMIVSLLGHAGCATIVSSGPDLIPVNSEPSGAKVLLDGIPVGRTPMTAAVNRKSDGVFTFELDGYSQAVRDESKVMNGWFAGNILLFGFAVIGIPVDLITSNQGKYSTDPIFVELVKNGRSGPDNSGDWKNN